MRRLTTGVLAACIALMFCVPAALACKGKDGKECDCDKPVLKVGFLLQSWVTEADNGNVAGDGWGNDLYLRRARLILAGRVNKLVNFFVETDNPNWGKNGDWSSEMYIQDAYVDFQIMKELNVAAGMILLPFTHANRQGATSLATLDYHNLFSEPFLPATKAWRDNGLEVRGILFDKWVDYRVGVFQGIRGKKCKDVYDKEFCDAGLDYAVVNPNDLPRITGRVAVNLFDAEEGFYYTGTNIGKKNADNKFIKILSVGAGVDFQPGATLDKNGEVANYMAFSGDVFADIPLSEKLGISGQLGVVWFNRGYAQTYKHPTKKDTDGKDVTTESKVEIDGEETLLVTKATEAGYAKPTLTETVGNGIGAYGDVGLRYRSLQPYVGGEWFSGDNNEEVGGNRMTARGGLIYWIAGHNASIKLEYAYNDKDIKKTDIPVFGTSDAGSTLSYSADVVNQTYSEVTLQVQLLFLKENLLGK